MRTSELDALGRAVQEMLAQSLERNDVSSDAGWGEETFGKRDD